MSMLKTNIKKLVVLFSLTVLFIGCTFICAPSSFADDSSEIPYLAPDLDQAELYQAASEVYDKIQSDDNLNNTRAATYTTDDIYYVLTTYFPLFNGDLSELSNYIQPDVSAIKTDLAQMEDYLYTLLLSVNGMSTSTSLSTSLYTLVNTIKEELHDYTSSTGGQTFRSYVDGYLANIMQYTGASAGSGITIANTTQSINNKIDTLVNSHNLNFSDLSSSFTFNGISEDLEGTYSIPSQTTYYSDAYLSITCNSNYTTLDSVLFTLPISIPNFDNYIIELYVDYTSTGIIQVPFEYYSYGRNILTLGFPSNIGNNTFFFRIFRHDDLSWYYMPDRSLSVQRLNDNSGSREYMSLISLYDINKKIENISSEVAYEPLRQAKKDSEEVIESSLEDFTGSGSGAAKVSDSKSMKNVSSAIQSGLSTGSSVSDALDIFTPNGSIWGWFTQQNYLDINNVNSTSSIVYTSILLRNYQLKPDGSFAYSSNWSVSDYIPVYSYAYIYYPFNAQSSIGQAICFYDINKNYISGVNFRNIFLLYNNYLPIPAGAYYARSSISNSSLEPSSFELFFYIPNNTRNSNSDSIIDFYSMNQLDIKYHKNNSLGDDYDR